LDPVSYTSMSCAIAWLHRHNADCANVMQPWKAGLDG
jgi:hypothetical protein